MTTVHEPQESYDGPATLIAEGMEVAGHPGHVVAVTLRGAFQPLDGHFHWYGRIADDPVTAALANGSTVRLRTEHGQAEGRLSDRDPWGRYRITGTGNPPF